MNIILIKHITEILFTKRTIFQNVSKLFHRIKFNTLHYHQPYQKMNKVHWPFKLNKIDIKCPISK